MTDIDEEGKEIFSVVLDEDEKGEVKEGITGTFQYACSGNKVIIEVNAIAVGCQLTEKEMMKEFRFWLWLNGRFQGYDIEVRNLTQPVRVLN